MFVCAESMMFQYVAIPAERALDPERVLDVLVCSRTGLGWPDWAGMERATKAGLILAGKWSAKRCRLHGF